MSDVLLEIGVEELPARFINGAEKQLKNNTKGWFKDHHIECGNITTYSTPRRLAVIIEDVAPEQNTIEEEIRGPQLKIARDENGEWTKAAVGFTKGQGKTVKDIYTKTIKNTEYIFVNKTTEGKNTKELLPSLKELIDNLHFPQTMRWGNEDYRFPRPLRWITALYDEQIIPIEVAGVTAGNITFGHRFLGSETTITVPSAYEDLLWQQYVIADPDKREKLIEDGIRKLEETASFHVEIDKGLLEEVRNLVEFPTVFYGEFESEYLKLPEEVLITSMKEHQRYFPVFNREKGDLLAYFVSVRNGDATKLDNVVRGNEKVLRARLQDAAFFYEEDKRHSIEFYNEKLKRVIFQEKIGTIKEKTENIQRVTSFILDKLAVDEQTKKTALRAAEISKFDLMTNMVNEFTELQGVMGEKYALFFNEDASTAKAVREHYLPIQSNGMLPESIQGAIVSTADKLDTIAGCFAAGLIPSGSQDPLGLRRQATGILQIMLDNSWDINLEDLITKACSNHDITDTSVVNQISKFFRDRVVYLLTDEQLEVDVIHSVLNDGIGVFSYTKEKIVLLSKKKHSEAFKPVQEALVRVMNIAANAGDGLSINPDLFETASETSLYEMYTKVYSTFTEEQLHHNASAALNELSRLKDPINEFFEHNMVMADDEKIKHNRLALTGCLSSMISMFADLTSVEWKQHHQ